MDLDDFEGAGGRKATNFNVLHLVIAALAVGIIALACVWLNSIAAAIFGAVGLLLGSYSMRMSAKKGPRNRQLPLAIAAVAMLFSVIGFMLGFVGLAS